MKTNWIQEAVKTRYLPTLRVMATTDSDFKCVAVLMLRKLLYGVPMDESLLVSSVLPKEVSTNVLHF